MFESCLKKQDQLLQEFASCPDQEARYAKLIALGRQLPALETQFKVPENIVKGCQSTMYLHSRFENGVVFFSAASDALISAGLAALLIRVYSGESPETILKCEPVFLKKLEMHTSLTPHRMNGLASLHLRMKQDALKHLLKG